MSDTCCEHGRGKRYMARKANSSATVVAICGRKANGTRHGRGKPLPYSICQYPIAPCTPQTPPHQSNFAFRIPNFAFINPAAQPRRGVACRARFPFDSHSISTFELIHMSDTCCEHGKGKRYMARKANSSATVVAICGRKANGTRHGRGPSPTRSVSTQSPHAHRKPRPTIQISHFAFRISHLKIRRRNRAAGFSQRFTTPCINSVSIRNVRP